MSSRNFLNNAISQLFDDIADKCHVTFRSFTINDNPNNIGKGINANQEYMGMYQETTDKHVYKYLYDPDLQFDFRFHQRLARVSYKNRKEPWCSLIFNTSQVKPVTNIVSHVYEGIQNADFEVNNKIVTEGVEYKFRRVVCPINFVLVSNELSYLYQTMERMALYFDRFINFTYKQRLQFSPLTVVNWDLVGQAQNIRQVNLEKLDTESKGSLALAAYSFELVYWDIYIENDSYGLLEKVILEVHEAPGGKLLYIDIIE